MPMLVLVSQQGPLPISVPFTAPSDAAAVLLVTGSVWTQNPNSMIGIEVFLDGNSLGAAQIFANPSGTHLPVVPIILPVKLSYGAHKIVLAQSTPATTCDTNDYYTVTLMY
jgi:hypothetical protein